MSPDEITVMDLGSAQAAWYERLRKASADRELCGSVEICPACWRPIDVLGQATSPFTGKPACGCGTAMLVSPAERLRLHGIDVPLGWGNAEIGVSPPGSSRVD